VRASKRSRRFALGLPVKYRVGGESRWRESRTVNVSPSGAVIAGEPPAALDSPIAVMISLAPAGGCLTGCGRIVRTEDEFDLPQFAIAVTLYAVEHGSSAIARLDSLLQGC
jgi:hypothetical protein